jgi:MFS superfamily sulfate permease-like transporter
MSQDISAPPAAGRLARPTASAAGWQRWLPGLRTLSEYRPEWAVNDLMAGLVLTAMLVPVGIAYAEASGVPGIYGLYATMIPLLAYAAVRSRAASWCSGRTPRSRRSSSPSCCRAPAAIRAGP